MKLDTLKPCPFCGREPQVRKSKKKWIGLNTPEFRQDYKVACVIPTCLMKPETKYEKHKEDAIKLWNTRPDSI